MTTEYEKISEQNKALVRRWYESLNDGDLSVIDKLFAPEFVSHDRTVPDGGSLEGLRMFGAMLRLAFPDLRFSIEEQLADGDRVITRYRVYGTHGGELMGVRQTGAKVEFTGIDISRVQNGKITETWSNWDALGVMQQVGAMPGTARGADRT